MKRKITDLYKELVLNEAKEPFHFSEKLEADKILEAYNPFCGDRFKIYISEDEKGIKEAWFFGYGCAISKASISILCRKISEENWPSIEKNISHFHAILHSNEILSDANSDPELIVFSAAKDFPGRLKCASLGWDALKAYIEEEKG